jgi:hypothetical protein
VTAPALQRLESIAARLQANADEWHTRAIEQQRAGGKGRDQDAPLPRVLV